jgi:hypothetical protein
MYLGTDILRISPSVPEVEKLVKDGFDLCVTGSSLQVLYTHLHTHTHTHTHT